MKRTNSRAAWVSLMAMLLLFAMLPACALAIDPFLPADHEDVGPDGYSIEIRFQTSGGEVANGVPMRMYQVATMTDRFATLKYTDDFAALASQIDLNNLDSDGWKNAVKKMAKYAEAEENGCTPCEEETVQKGGIIFRQRDAGLYLIVFDRCVEETRYFDMAPQLVAVPFHPVGSNNEQDKETWKYHVVIEGKIVGYDRDDLIDITVYKQWSDPGWSSSSRPEEIEITLFADGEPYGDPIYLPRLDSNDAEHWDYTWENLDPLVEWTVEESEVENYTARYDPPYGRVEQVSAHEYEVTITNYRPAKPSSSLPQTGVNWTPVIILAVAGMVLCCLGWMARRADEESDEA